MILSPLLCMQLCRVNPNLYKSSIFMSCVFKVLYSISCILPSWDFKGPSLSRPACSYLTYSCHFTSHTAHPHSVTVPTSKLVSQCHNSSDVDDVLSGDEIIEVNGVELSWLTHSEAVANFKRIRRGQALLLVRRRTRVTANYNRSVTTVATVSCRFRPAVVPIACDFSTVEADATFKRDMIRYDPIQLY